MSAVSNVNVSEFSTLVSKPLMKLTCNRPLSVATPLVTRMKSYSLPWTVPPNSNCSTALDCRVRLPKLVIAPGELPGASVPAKVRFAWIVPRALEDRAV